MSVCNSPCHASRLAQLRNVVTQMLWIEEDHFLSKKDELVKRSIAEQKYQNVFCSQGG